MYGVRKPREMDAGAELVRPLVRSYGVRKPREKDAGAELAFILLTQCRHKAHEMVLTARLRFCTQLTISR